MLGVLAFLAIGAYQGAYSFKLAGGCVAQLVSVSLDGGAGWAPDGSPTTDRIPTVESSTQNPGHPEFNSHTVVNDKGFVAHLHATKVEMDSIFLGNGYGCTAGSSFGETEQDNTTDMYFALSPKPRATTAGLEIGFAPLSFRLYEEEALGKGKLSATTGLNETETVARMGPASASLTWSGLSVHVTVPRSLLHKQLRLAAILMNGSTRYCEWMGLASMGRRPDEHPSVERFSFPRLKANQIKRIQLWARDVQWVTFSGIHLAPNP